MVGLPPNVRKVMNYTRAADAAFECIEERPARYDRLYRNRRVFEVIES